MKPINYLDNYLVIEFTNKCNLKCIHCAQSLMNEHYETYGNFSKELLIELLEDLYLNKIRFSSLILFWLGEPTLHPNFKEMYSIILNYNRKYNLFNNIELHTNATLLKREYMDLAFENQDLRQTWHFTLDAINKETYKAIKGTDNMDKAYENAKEMIKLKSILKATYPRLVCQFIVQEKNYKEALEFRDFWADKFNENNLNFEVVGYHVLGEVNNAIFFRQLDALDFSQQDYANKLYEYILKKVNISNKRLSILDKYKDLLPRTHKICSAYWKSPVINWDGRVTVCTRDSTLNLQVGDLRENKFSEIWWNNPRLNEMRDDAANKDLSNLKLCQGCIIPYSSNYTNIKKEEIEEYKRIIKEEFIEITN